MEIGKERQKLRWELQKTEHMKNRIFKQIDGMLDKLMSLDEVIDNLKVKLDVKDGRWERRKDNKKPTTLWGKMCFLFRGRSHANL